MNANKRENYKGKKSDTHTPHKFQAVSMKLHISEGNFIHITTPTALYTPAQKGQQLTSTNTS